jgi:hypothetical protein
MPNSRGVNTDQGSPAGPVRRHYRDAKTRSFPPSPIQDTPFKQFNGGTLKDKTQPARTRFCATTYPVAHAHDRLHHSPGASTSPHAGVHSIDSQLAAYRIRRRSFRPRTAPDPELPSTATTTFHRSPPCAANGPRPNLLWLLPDVISTALIKPTLPSSDGADTAGAGQRPWPSTEPLPLQTRLGWWRRSQALAITP